MIDNFKPLGAFVENTIRPLLDESRGLFVKLQNAGIPLTKPNLRDLIHHIARLHIRGLIWQFATTCVITIGAVTAVWLITRK